MPGQATVHVIAGKSPVGTALRAVLDEAGFDVEMHESPSAFLAALGERPTRGVVLQVQPPRPLDSDLSDELARRANALPVVHVSASGSHGDEPRPTQSAAKNEPLVSVVQPVEGLQLVEYLEAMMRARDGQAEDARTRLAALTHREREVMLLALQGLTNKDIATRLHISYRTVETHRSHALHKARAAHLLEFARLIEIAREGPTLLANLRARP